MPDELLKCLPKTEGGCGAWKGKKTFELSVNGKKKHGVLCGHCKGKLTKKRKKEMSYERHV